ncbi:polyadenylate-binding protein RBP45-like [Diospyros lotus]|uniref:polyadenylate-binding protein RBP45-like n=1 Tax=Diospyros lotus TaxID=55363 RepID=UPI0022539A9A|nr:polyadenylate-binding protein RBP45-like [Diospyros lotus]
MMQPAPNMVQQPMAPAEHQQNHHHLQYQQQQQQQQQQQPWPMPNQPQQHFQYQPQAQMYYQQQQQQQPQLQAAGTQAQYPATQPSSADEIRTLWIGDLQYWMDEQYLLSSFAHSGEVVSAKVIRNKQTGQSEGYGFIEFVSHAAAERTLQAYNGSQMPNAEQNYRLNWASFGAGEKRSDGTPDFTIFVGDLASDVTDYMLQETFRAHYPSVKGAKVVTDRMTGRTKGYGFVKFGDENEQLRAMNEMNGQFCSTRPMRIGPANKKNLPQNTQGIQSEDDPNNTTIFVGGLNDNVSDDQLRQIFSPYGQLVHVKIPPGKRCGFVQFADRHSAEEALRMLNGTQLGGQNIRLSWGRNPSNKQVQPQVDSNQWNGGYYGYTQGYGTYGYSAAAQDPNLYYGGYAGYGNYQQPPSQQQQ